LFTTLGAGCGSGSAGGGGSSTLTVSRFGASRRDAAVARGAGASSVRGGGGLLVATGGALYGLVRASWRAASNSSSGTTMNWSSATS